MPSHSSTTLPPIPLDTARAVVDSFDEENLYIQVGNSLENILRDLSSSLFERPLQHISIPGYVFSLITIFQYQERLTDDEMAESVRSRPEVRYGLRLAMKYPNVSAPSLCQYRRLLYEDTSSFKAFEKVAERVTDFTSQSTNGNNGYSFVK